MRETAVKAAVYRRITDMINYFEAIAIAYDAEEKLAAEAIKEYLKQLEIGVEVKGGVIRVYHKNGVMSITLAEWEDCPVDGGEFNGKSTDERDDGQELGC